DKQTFRVQLVAVRYRPNEVQFVPDKEWVDAGLKQAGGIAPSITLPDWTLEKWEIKNMVYALAPGRELSGYAFEFTALRNVQHYILKVILPYMTRLDTFIFTSTLLVFFSLIEVLLTTILENRQQTERAKKIDRYCRVIFPVIFAIASIAIFVKPRD